jgi:hypothetical protein
MREIVEVLLSIGVPTAGLVWYALVLARKEDREARGETVSGTGSKGRTAPTLVVPDPDAHLGRVGSE